MIMILKSLGGDSRSLCIGRPESSSTIRRETVKPPRSEQTASIDPVAEVGAIHGPRYCYVRLTCCRHRFCLENLYNFFRADCSSLFLRLASSLSSISLTKALKQWSSSPSWLRLSSFSRAIILDTSLGQSERSRICKGRGRWLSQSGCCCLRYYGGKVGTVQYHKRLVACTLYNRSVKRVAWRENDHEKNCKDLKTIKRLWIQDWSVFENYFRFLFQTEHDSVKAPKIVLLPNLMSLLWTSDWKHCWTVWLERWTRPIVDTRQKAWRREWWYLRTGWKWRRNVGKGCSDHSHCWRESADALGDRRDSFPSEIAPMQGSKRSSLKFTTLMVIFDENGTHIWINALRPSMLAGSSSTHTWLYERSERTVKSRSNHRWPQRVFHML